MSRPAPSTGLAARLQELRTDRRAQIMLLAFLGALAFMVWTLTSGSTKRPRRAAARAAAASPLPDRQRQALERFAGLARLGLAGELPSHAKLHRDLFLFDGPPPPPPPRPPDPPPPPPPTEEQLRAQAEQQARQGELASRPQSLRYLGFLERASTGRIGGFMRGEEALTLRVGDFASPTWRLVALDETHAEFQNLKYPDLRHRLDITEAGAAAQGGVSNQF